MLYPNQKFITDEIVQKICKKYSLVCADISRFKGFVPLEKISAIEEFKLNYSDYPPIMITNVVFSYTASQSAEIRKIKSYGKIYPISSLIGGSHIDIKSLFPGDTTFRSGSYATIASYEKLENQKMMICAPKKYMDLSGLNQTKEGIFSMFTRVECPDPVVLQPVKGGYLIIAAWGDEASDEMVVNPKSN